MSYRRKVKRKIKMKKIISKKLVSIMILLIAVFFVIKNVDNGDIQEKKITQMKQIDEKLSYANSTEVKTYYVSADGTSTDGTDINNPMSLSEAKKKTYYGNEKVLLKCGDIFYGTLNFNVQAEEDKMFYVGSYGEGEKPIICGANILINKEAWTLEKEGIYKIDLSNYSNFEGIGKTFWDPYNIGFLADEKDNIYGYRKSTIEELNNEFDFCCKDNYLYIKSNSNPTDKLGKIKFIPRNDLVKLSSNTILSGINIQYTGAHGIVKKDDEIENVYVKDCIIENIGGCVQVPETFTRYGNGLEFWNQAENTLVEGCIFRNIYDAAYSMQGNTTTSGFINNVCQNNVFINCTYTYETFCRNKNDSNVELYLKNQKFINNVSINQGQGWGAKVREDKTAVSEFVIWVAPLENTDIEITGNTYLNSMRLKYRSDVYNLTQENFSDIVHSDNNKIYLNPNTYLVNNEGNYQDQSILEKYKIDQNSKIELLTEEMITKISNPTILNSNDYTQIKTYYENIEKEIKFSELAETTITKYTDFQQKYQTDLSQMQDISTTIETLKNEVKTLTTANLWTHLETLYKTGETIITKYQNKTTNLSKQKIEEILTEINKIGESYINLINNMQITQNPEITDLQTLLQTADKLNLSIAENSDLDISDEKTWRDTIKDSLETIQLEGTTAEHKSYHYIKAKNILTWTSNMLDIYIDEYIQANPINITYSTTALTNKDVIATLNIGTDSHVTNNNNKNTYTFQENGEYTFEYERRGRNFQAKATVNNIDKTAPKITGAEDGQVYNQSVKLQITDQNLEKIELYLNGTLQENYTQTQNITQEGFYEVKATDKAGNITTVSFDVIYREEEDYDVTKDKICNITVNTTAEKISEKLPFEEKYTILRNEKELQNGEKVATGDILKLASGRQYTLIVKGDLNSDGTVNIVDLVRTQNAILKRRQLTEIEELAADANYDKEQITIKDLVRIQMTILNPPKM